MVFCIVFFFFKQKTAYEMRISDWSSDVCSSDLMTNHVARNTPNEHIISFYRDWEDIRADRFDGFIVTGAPVETMPFEQVTYWDELRRIFDWTQTNVQIGRASCRERVCQYV